MLNSLECYISYPDGSAYEGGIQVMMVLLLDGNSEPGTHVWGKVGN